ncbi:MAG: hypothetical protein HZA50_10670 [Planctomycetes bacterium]|nr:hypothetical protein [Planctomycetota bacterium]
MRTKAAFRTFLIWFCSASAASAAMVAGGLAAARGFDVAPPPAVSANICFNEKALFIHDRGGPACDVLAVGSSTTLGDLDSRMLADALGRGRRYLNAGAWGMTVCETRKFLELLLECGARPRYVLMVCAITDFHPPVGAAFWDAADTPKLLRGEGYWPAMAGHFELGRIVSEGRQAARDRRKSDEYTTLMFDAWGGSMLDKTFPDVSRGRWEMKPLPEKIDPTQYEQLAGLADMLAGRGIGLVCVQGPIRPAVMDDATATLCRRHWQRVERILADRAFTFVNLQSRLTLDDSMFADSVHLNRAGVAKFTAALLELPEFREAIGLAAVSSIRESAGN